MVAFPRINSIARAQHLILAAILIIAGAYYIASAPPDIYLDSDASHYIMLGRNLANGTGFIDTSRPGNPIDTWVPPLFPLMLAPLIGLFPNWPQAMQVQMMILMLGAAVLAYAYFGLKRVPIPLRLGITALFALNPYVALFGAQVMAEAPFIFTIMLLLIALHFYDQTGGVFNRWAWVVGLLIAAQFYLKTAGLPIVAAVPLYYLITGRWRQAVAISIAPSVLIGALFASRLAIGDPIIGYGYQTDLDTFYGVREGSGIAVLINTAVTNIGRYLNANLGVSITGVIPLPELGRSFRNTVMDTPLSAAVSPLFSLLMGPLLVYGFFVYHWRHRDATLLIVPAYFAMTLFWPNINPRRVVLLMPVVVAYLVVALDSLINGVLPHLLRRRWVAQWVGVAFIGLMVYAMAARAHYQVLLGPTFEGAVGRRRVDFTDNSPMIRFLKEVPGPDDVIESPYGYLYHYMTGKKFLQELWSFACNGEEAFWAGLNRVKPRFILLTGRYWGPLQPDNNNETCIFPILARHPDQFVRVLSMNKDRVQLFEVLYETPDAPTRRNLTAKASYSTTISRPVMVPSANRSDLSVLVLPAPEGQAEVTVTFQPAQIDTVTLGAAWADAERIGAIAIALQGVDGTWTTLASFENVRIGEMPNDSPTAPTFTEPYFYYPLPTPMEAIALRVQLRGGTTFYLTDLNAIGTPLQENPAAAMLSGTTVPTVHQGAWLPAVAKWSGDVDSVAFGNPATMVLPGPNPFTLQVNVSPPFPLSSETVYPLGGVWEAGGRVQPGYYQQGEFRLLTAQGWRAFRFGQAGDRPVVGDWDGDGVTTVGVYRAGTFYLTNTPFGDTAEIVLPLYTPPADDPTATQSVPLVGDWDGDGKDSLGLRYDGNVFALWNRLEVVLPDQVVPFGLPTDYPVAGDWDGDQRTDLGVLRAGVMFVALQPDLSTVQIRGVAVGQVFDLTR
jgi:hypothetical protein